MVQRFKSTKSNNNNKVNDRGAICRAYNVQSFARILNLKFCFTAAYSPESNGMAEALVKTIKRDYVYVSDCENAEVVLSMIEGWFEDYNKAAPHSALGMKSPIEYRLSIKNGLPQMKFNTHINI